MTNAISGYDSWINSLHSRNIKTTSTGANEANFQDYIGALSEDLKQEIAASYDDEHKDADQNILNVLASKLKNNLIQSTDLKSALAGTGITYSVEYRKTSYIVDNKKGGSYMNNKNATNGAIAVYTFKGPNGGEVKIADANGNGALESEEIFMNELLSGVVSDVSVMNTSHDTEAFEQQTQALMQQMQEQFQQSQQQLAEMMQQIEEQALQALQTGDTNGNGEFEEEEITDYASGNVEEQQKQEAEQVQKKIRKIIEANYPDLPDGRLDDVVKFVTDHITTGSTLNINQLLERILGTDETTDTTTEDTTTEEQPEEPKIVKKEPEDEVA